MVVASLEVGPRMNLIAYEFECPEHGRFEALVPRADDPDEWPCPYPECCDDHTCGRPSPWRISAPLFKPQYGAVKRGKSDERPPWALNTEALADGMSPSEWNANQNKIDRDARRKQNRERLG